MSPIGRPAKDAQVLVQAGNNNSQSPQQYDIRSQGRIEIHGTQIKVPGYSSILFTPGLTWELIVMDYPGVVAQY